MSASNSSPPVEHLVDAVLQSFGQIATLVEHMARFAGSGAEPLPVVLRRLLVDALTPMADAGDEAAVRTTAQVLCAATATVGAELYVVPTATAPCARRRPAAPRRARGTH